MKSEPIDPDVTPPLCPRCFSEGRAGCCITREWERTRLAAESAYDPDDQGLYLWEQVDRGWSRRYGRDQEAYGAELDRLRGLLTQALDLLEETSDYADGGWITSNADRIRREARERGD